MVKENEKRESRFTAEFSMGELEYERISKLLSLADIYGVAVRNLEMQYAQPFYATLKQIYLNIQPIMYATKRTELQKKFKEIDQVLIFERKRGNLKPRSGRVNHILINRLDEVFGELMVVKQKMNMGISVIKRESHRSKLKRALKG